MAWIERGGLEQAMAYFDSETEQPPEVARKFKEAIEAAKRDDTSQYVRVKTGRSPAVRI